MADTAVNVVVKTQGQQSLDRLANSFKKTETQLKKLKGSIDGKLDAALKRTGEFGARAGERIKRAFDKARASAQNFKKNLGPLQKALGGLAIGATVKGALDTGLDRLQSEARLTASQGDTTRFLRRRLLQSECQTDLICLRLKPTSSLLRSTVDCVRLDCRLVKLKMLTQD